MALPAGLGQREGRLHLPRRQEEAASRSGGRRRTASWSRPDSTRFWSKRPASSRCSPTVTLKHGEQKEMEVKLVRVSYGFLRIDSNAPEIKVRDRRATRWASGSSGEPPLDVEVARGRHRAHGRERRVARISKTTIEVPRGQVLPVHAQMIPNYPRGAAWTQAIIGAAFIGAAASFGTESNRIHERARGRPRSWRARAETTRARPRALVRDRRQRGLRDGRRAWRAWPPTTSSRIRCRSPRRSRTSPRSSTTRARQTRRSGRHRSGGRPPEPPSGADVGRRCVTVSG